MKVWLIGAGPGSADLITVRGLRVLQSAQVVLYDYLVDPRLLDEAPVDAERICVGKAPGYHSMTQTAINALLSERARRGKRVVRLKGGDPFLFGRGGEEMLALRADGVDVEIVPGVSAVLAAPASAGVPVTLRGVSRCVTIVSGHDGDVDVEPNGTLVVLMGVARLPVLVSRLAKRGWKLDTPVAIIENATTSRERVFVGTLGGITDQAHRAGLASPATIVIGDVAALAQQGADAQDRRPSLTAVVA